MTEEVKRTERKTVDVEGLGKKDMYHKDYDRQSVKTGWLGDKVFQNEVKDKEGKTVAHVVRGSLMLKEPAVGKNAPFVFFEAMTKEKLDIEQYINGAKPLRMPGQVFRGFLSRDDDGKPKGSKVDKLYVRSIYEAEKDEKGKWKSGLCVSSPENAIKDEYERAAKNNAINGMFYRTEHDEVNHELKNNEGKVMGYAHKLFFKAEVYDEKGNRAADKDGKPLYEAINVEFKTREKKDFEKLGIFSKGAKDGPPERNRINLVGAERVYDYKGKNEEWVHGAVVFEPDKFRIFKEKDIDKPSIMNPRTDSGVYKGKITSIENGYVYQEIGKTTIKHDVKDISDKLPSVGESCKISYKEGKAKISPLREKEKGVEM